ncbi:putative cytokinetic ring protein SteA [Georgenia sp. SYP-B2076]|uniref:putative cytokinetic ring protein SteA n=1 Tax=Georgenia sp. SYP-B2076 TaxID=2495881 RepID=UPI000F8EBAB1|nr:putative cytokinetic ring protein SteA [Georgenia sp. SYP-B2076]
MTALFRRRRAVLESGSGTSGPARVDARTKNLTKRLQPGDVAVIDHEDLDRVSAEALVACKPVAVLNAARSTSGRYPNLGPGILVDAGIPLVDDLGPAVMSVREGQHLDVSGNEVRAGDELVAEGTAQDPETIEKNMAEAREGLSVQLEAFAANTMDYVQRERELLFDGVGVPEVRTSFEGRQALVVVRGYHYKEDLAMLRSYIREYRPLLVGVDGGADAILEAGMKPDMIVGDMDSVSDKALRSGAEIVVHAYRDGRAPGQQRVQDLGVEHVVFPATGTSEDIAMLLADDLGAELIVAVGTHDTMVEFLDKGRSGMASTFLTRLRVGSKLIDAKGVSRLYRTRISTWQLVLLALAGLLALFVALAATNVGQTIFGLSGAWLDDLVNFFRSLVGLAPTAPAS